MTLSTIFLKTFKLSALATALTLAGCGGGGGNDTVQPAIPTGSMVNVTNPTTSTDSTTTTNLASVNTVQLVSNDNQFFMSTDTTIELTVYALNKDNIGVANVPVNVKITDPKLTGVFSNTPQGLVTDASGKATITLDVQSLTTEQKNYLQQNGVEIQATVGTKSDTKTLTGVNTQTSGPVTTALVQNLLLVSDNNTLPLTIGRTIKVTAIAIDADNNIVANTPITFNISS